MSTTGEIKRYEILEAVASSLERVGLQQMDVEEVTIVMGRSLYVSLGEPAELLGIEVTRREQLHDWAFLVGLRPIGFVQTEVPFYR